jgi:hypothetical protein
MGSVRAERLHRSSRLSPSGLINLLCSSGNVILVAFLAKQLAI